MMRVKCLLFMKYTGAGDRAEAERSELERLQLVGPVSQPAIYTVLELWLHVQGQTATLYVNDVNGRTLAEQTATVRKTIVGYELTYGDWLLVATVLA